MFLLALLLAGVATFAAVTYLKNKEAAIKAELESGVEYTEIIVPLRDLGVGDVIDTSTVSARAIPSDYVPDSAMAAGTFESVAGMTVIEPVSYGRPLLRHQIKGLSGVARFSELLRKGQRAISINVDTLDTNAFMLRPGDIIDLVLLAEEEKSSKSSKKDVQVVPLLDRVTVLAADFVTIDKPPMGDELTMAGFGTITLGIDIKDVPLILQARERGELSYLLRHPEDDKPLKNGLDRESLEQVSQIRVFAGGKAKNGHLVSTTMVTRPVTQQVLDDEGNPRIVRKFRGKSENEAHEISIPTLELSSKD